MNANADDQATQEIGELLEVFATAWSKVDLQRVAEQWDPVEPGSTYVAEELGEVLHGHQEIVSHLMRSEHRIASAEVEISEVEVRLLADDLALAVFVVRWFFEWVSYSRVSAVFRRRAGQWRFVHYMEAPHHLEDGDAELR